jgi:hypothetical protein
MRRTTIVRSAVAVALAAVLALAAPAQAAMVGGGPAAAVWSDGWAWGSGFWARLAGWILGGGGVLLPAVRKSAVTGNDGTASGAPSSSSSSSSSGGTPSGDAGAGINPDGGS